jgi:uncharacterized protein YkwD
LAAAGCRQLAEPTPSSAPVQSITATPFLPAGFAGLPTGDVPEPSTIETAPSVADVEQAPAEDQLGVDLAAVIDAVNQMRDREGESPLHLSFRLSELAQSRAEDLSRTQSLWHVETASGRTPGQLMIEAGYSGALAEHAAAIAIDAEDPVGVLLQAMLTDSAHRRNLLGEQFSVIGMGVSTDGQWWYVVQLLAQGGPGE